MNAEAEDRLDGRVDDSAAGDDGMLAAPHAFALINKHFRVSQDNRRDRLAAPNAEAFSELHFDDLRRRPASLFFFRRAAFRRFRNAMTASARKTARFNRSFLIVTRSMTRSLFGSARSRQVRQANSIFFARVFHRRPPHIEHDDTTSIRSFSNFFRRTRRELI